MEIIKSVFEFWKYDHPQVALLLESKEKPYFLRLEKLIQITELPIQLLPSLIGSKIFPVFYEVGEITNLGFPSNKENTFIKDLKFQYSKLASIFRSELRNVPFQINDYIVVHGRVLYPNGVPNDQLWSSDYDDYWINYDGENTLRLDSYALVGDEKHFKLVCLSYASEEQQFRKVSFERRYYKHTYYIDYRNCRLATTSEIDEFEIKSLERYQMLRDAASQEIYESEIRKENERDNFDALTDGQFGDFDEFNGDNSSLRDGLGL